MLKFKHNDFDLLRGALLFLTTAMVVSAVWWVGSWQYRQMLEDEKNSAQRSLNAARAQLDNARAQQKYFNENQATYGELRTRGLFGEERRLDWIETIRRLRDRNQIFTIDYDIAPQRRFVADASNVVAFSSKIDIKFDLLHEQDLLDFLTDFNKQAPGIFLLDSCALKRQTRGMTSGEEANLAGACTMQWVTVKEKSS
jgi:hypothetical protein